VRAVVGRIKIMEWTTPKFEEIALNCEINSYASAAL
jgi:coenzyme PQQ precursor peptide PqqA